MDFKDKPYLLFNGDCLEVMKTLADNSVDCVITDPPYSTPTVTAFGRKKIMNLADLSIQEFYFRAIRDEIERILKPNGRLFIFCDDKYYPILFALFYEWQSKNLLIWDKKVIGMGNPFRRRHELIFYANRDVFDCYKTEGITHYPTVIQFSHEADKVHGAQKPVGLIEYLIKGFTKPQEIVLDMFLGSGTTGVACINTHRHFVGIELNEKYFKIAESRIKRANLEPCDIPQRQKENAPAPLFENFF